MIEWTQPARELFEEYCMQNRQQVLAQGADPDEVKADLRAHIEQELAAQGVAQADYNRVKSLLLQLGDFELFEDCPSGAVAKRNESAAPRPPSAFRLGCYWVFGVILPLVVIGIELVTHMCAETFFNPMPTLLHTALVLLVPVANALGLLVHAQSIRLNPKFAGGLNGLAIGVGAFYTLMFTPLCIIGVFMVLVGLGLLPMAPFFSLYVALKVRGLLKSSLAARAQGAGAGLIHAGWGLLAAAVLLTLPELPASFTMLMIKQAATAVPEQQVSALSILRSVGSEKVMHSACSQASNMGFILPILFRSCDLFPSEEQACQVYYRVTGTSHTHRRPEFSRKSPMGWNETSREDFFDWDENVGGAIVGKVRKQLALEHSKLDASLAPDAMMGYVEWTMTFRNTSSWREEARAQIQLPPGAVVSRLTLWVNDEEREAVVAGSGKVRQAYQSVVNQRRDPVLVTTCGPGQVLVQCFPVPANGGTIKIRLGITQPLQAQGPQSTQAAFVWPRLLDRNFSLSEDFAHSLWLESPQPLTAPSGSPLTAEHPGEKVYALRGPAPDALLQEPQCVIQAQRDTNVDQVWTPDPLSTCSLIVQHWTEQPPFKPSRIAVVVDGSLAMKESAAQLASSLQGLPAGPDLTLYLAADQPIQALESTPVTPQSLRQAASLIEQHTFVGGCDNLPALEMAWEWAAQSPGSVILWCHGPQPEDLGSAEGLIQRWTRRPGSPQLFTLAAVEGNNRLLRTLAQRPELKPIPRLGTLEADLTQTLKGWDGITRQPVLAREHKAISQAQPSGPQTSSHLARLWAWDEYLRLQEKQPGQAQKLAAAYRIVTPSTGAVVLENDQQYKDAGLTPPGDATVPTIPEPSDWLLLAACLATAAMAWRRMRCNRSCAPRV